MIRIAIVTLLAFAAATQAHPETNGPEVHDHTSLIWSPAVGPDQVIGFVGPRKDALNDAVFGIPNEPTGNYDTLMKREVLPYGASNPWFDAPRYDVFRNYDAGLCGRMCNSVTKSSQPTWPYINDAKPVCNMFVAYELLTISSSKYLKAGHPMSMVCELYTSVWSGKYQTVREVADFVQTYPAKLRPTKVALYDREGYPFPPICAMREACGKDYYAGGDCSGWGKGHC